MIALGRIAVQPALKALMEGEVHVWHAAPQKADLVSRLSILAPDERERAAAYTFEKDRDLYVLARVLLRTVLSTYRDVSPAQWRFVTTNLGKPHIDQPEEGRLLEFNISHTEGLVACAVTWQRPVGIDVESTNRPLDWDFVARLLAPDEYQQIVSKPHYKRQETFLSLWTLKEAYAKACGRGLSLGMNESRFVLTEEGGCQAARLDPMNSEWSFFCPNLSAEYRVAVAVQHQDSPPPRLKIFDERRGLPAPSGPPG